MITRIAAQGREAFSIHLTKGQAPCAILYCNIHKLWTKFEVGRHQHLLGMPSPMVQATFSTISCEMLSVGSSDGSP